MTKEVSNYLGIMDTNVQSFFYSVSFIRSNYYFSLHLIHSLSLFCSAVRRCKYECECLRAIFPLRQLNRTSIKFPLSHSKYVRFEWHGLAWLDLTWLLASIQMQICAEYVSKLVIKYCIM